MNTQNPSEFKEVTEQEFEQFLSVVNWRRDLHHNRDDYKLVGPGEVVARKDMESNRFYVSRSYSNSEDLKQGAT